MPYQNINASLSEEDRESIVQAIKTIESKMPFLISLAAEERQKLYKLGDRRLSFARTSLNAARSNPDILPKSFDLESFTQDYQLASDLNEILLLLRQLTEKVEDTTMAVGSGAMTSSLEFYDYAKTAAKRTPGLKSIVEQLGSLFKVSNNRTEPVDSE